MMANGNEQLALGFEGSVADPPGHEAEFRHFIQHNPHLVERIEHEALRAKRSGWKHYAVKTLFEFIRHHTNLEQGPDGSGFKLNNNYTSRMARYLMAKNPELRGFFETRKLNPKG